MKKLLASVLLAVLLALSLVPAVLAVNQNNVCVHLAKAAVHAAGHPSDNSKIHECSITA